VKIKEMSAANPSLEKEEVPHHPSRFCERATTELKGQISFFWMPRLAKYLNRDPWKGYLTLAFTEHIHQMMLHFNCGVLWEKKVVFSSIYVVGNPEASKLDIQKARKTQRRP